MLVGALQAGGPKQQGCLSDSGKDQVAEGAREESMLNTLQGLLAFAKGGGKGGEAQPSAKFEGYCNFCGGWGHRLSECKKKDSEMALMRQQQQQQQQQGAGQGGALKGKGEGDKWWKGGAPPQGWKGKGKGKGNKSLNELEEATGQHQPQEEPVWDEAPVWMLGHLGKAPINGPKFFPCEGTEESEEEEAATAAQKEGGSRGEAWPAPAGMTAPQCRHRQCRCEGTVNSNLCAEGTPRGKAAQPRMRRIPKKAWLSMPWEEGSPEEAMSRPPATGAHGKTLAAMLRASELDGSATPEDGWQLLPPRKMLCKLQRGMKQIEIVIDSGAAESVIPADLLPGHPIAENAASLAGERYLTADGKQIPNRGEQRITFKTWEGHDCSLRLQVADVTKPLLSVAQLVDTGHDVAFGRTGGTIRHPQTGRTIAFTRRAGLYVLPVWVHASEEPSEQLPGFHRPGMTS